MRAIVTLGGLCFVWTKRQEKACSHSSPPILVVMADSIEILWLLMTGK